MATNDQPSRIDQIFADRRLIDEALAAAAVDAADRHRRAGVPLVVVRDGRIEHVPADRFVPDPDSLLIDADFAEERTAKDWIAWYEERRSAIKKCLLAREPASLHKGQFKRFYEELYPFVLWLSHLYAGREDVIGALNSERTAARDYDAVVKDPTTVRYVQLTTTTFNRSEWLNRKKLLTEGCVVYPTALTQDEWRQQVFKKIEVGIRNKSRHSFGRDYVLVVSFDDFMWFGTDDDRDALRAFVSERLAGWRLNVATLYIAGLSGRTFESFPVPRR